MNALLPGRLSGCVSAIVFVIRRESLGLSGSCALPSSLARTRSGPVVCLLLIILVHLLTAVPSPRWQHYGSQTALLGEKLAAGPALGFGGFAPDRDPASAPHFAAECFFLTQLAMHYCLLPAGAPCLPLLLASLALHCCVKF